MNRIDPELNPLEVLIVTEKLKEAGIEDYQLRRGNRCIWATYGRISEYYIFQDGCLVDVQID